MPYKYGRRAPKNAPALSFGSILQSGAPGYPPTENYLGTLTGWQMLGNDVAGDCITPETRVLTADLRWLAAGDLSPGDALLSF